jgi:hypothetical protein
MKSLILALIVCGLSAVALSQAAENVRRFGAAGDGKKDDTAALQAALDHSRSIHIPDGTYLISCDAPANKTWTSGGLSPQSDSTVTFAPRAILKCQPSKTGHYVALRLKDVNHVTISGGTLDGNRTAAAATAPANTEWGFGIGCWGCQHVTLRNITAQNFWGDGFYFAASKDTGQTSQDIQAHELRAKGNRRNGASFISVTGWKCVHCRFELTAGTAPQAGVDIEPGRAGVVRDWECNDCEFTKNAVYGVAVGGYSGPLIDDVRLIGGRAEFNGQASSSGNNYGGAGIQISNHPGEKALLRVEVSRMVIANNGPKANGIQISNGLEGSVNIHHNDIYGNGDETDDQVTILTSTGVSLLNNTIRTESGGPPRARWGLLENGDKSSRVRGNQWCNAGTKGNLSSYASTGLEYSENSECSATSGKSTGKR